MRHFLFCAFFFLFLACADKESLPQDIIQPQTMQKIVWDMLQADEVALQNKLKDTSIILKTESFRLYDQVFAIHKIARNQFYTSYKYYQKNPALYKALMEGIKTIAEKERKLIITPEKL